MNNLSSTAALELASLSDISLLIKTRTLASEERKLTALVLSHLQEIERRRLHLETHSSLFDFCRRELGYSESEATSRISAMRLSREVPEVIAKVEAGELSLTNLVRAQVFFRQEAKAGKRVTQAEKKELLLELEGKSTRDCERLLVARSPLSALPPERERVISPSHTLISFNADDRLKEDLDKIRAFWGHHGVLTYAELFQKMAEVVLKKLDPTGAKKTDSGITSSGKTKPGRTPGRTSEQPTKPIRSPGAHEVVSDAHAGVINAELIPPPEFVSPGTRHIPNTLRRKIWRRDDGRCTHSYAKSDTHTSLKSEMRCESRFALEIDHVIPWSHGGTHTEENLRLLCRAHHRQRTLKEERTPKQQSTLKPKSSPEGAKSLNAVE